MTAWEGTYEERQARIAAERAAWPDLYATVREALELGFLPGAYGNGGRDDGQLLRPPTKFGYPVGGLAYPHHVHGPAEGARLMIFSHQDASPDDIRDQPVWAAGADWNQLGGLYTTRWGLTLPEAFAYCIACAQHIQRHFIVPGWRDGGPVMPARHWRELQALRTAEPDARAPVKQLDMFAPPPPEQPYDPQLAMWEAVFSLPADAPDDQPWHLPYGRTTYDVEHLIDRANRRRKDAGVPPLEFATENRRPMKDAA